jgi:hypothetical protein
MNIKYILPVFIGALTIGATGCKKDFLNLDPVDRYTYFNFPINSSQIDQAIVANYRKLVPIFNNHMWVFGDMLSDNTSFRYNPNDRGGINIEEMDEFVAIADNGTFNGLYQESYESIRRANIVLDAIDPIFFASDSIKRIRKAEARFFRAWNYFNLVRLYGDVPMITKVEIDPLIGGNPVATYPRVPVSEIYEKLILPDVAFAIDSLPLTVPTTETGRLRKAAARMLMAKILMTQKKFADAIPHLRAITTSGFALAPQYVTNFNPATKNGVESILEVQADPALGYSFGFMSSWTPWGTGNRIWPGGSNSRGGLNQPTASLDGAFEPGDSRKPVIIGVDGAGAAAIRYMNKFNYWDVVNRANPSNFPVYRYADVLLMLAECINEVGFPNAEAFTLLNQVRNRAGLPNKSQNNPQSQLSVNSQSEFRMAIEQERRVELAGEGHRWFDLVRTDRAVEVMTAHGVQEKALKPTVNPNAYTNIKLLLPIPNREVQQFGYNQNPGW